MDPAVMDLPPSVIVESVSSSPFHQMAMQVCGCFISEEGRCCIQDCVPKRSLNVSLFHISTR